jgi:hypothetical protein
MRTPNESAGRVSRRGRLARRVLAVSLLAAALAGCTDQPVEPGDTRAAPAGPSLTLNAACDTALGGQVHTAPIITSETWSRANNPHRVNALLNVAGSAVLTIAPGVLVCFGTDGGLYAHTGGRLVVNGLDTARIVLTAVDPANGWWGVHMAGSPGSPSSLWHVRLEHTDSVAALSTHDGHAVQIDSSVFRQNALGLFLWGTGSAIRRSRVDTVTTVHAGVILGSNTTFEKTTIRGSAGVGLAVLGTGGITLLGGRIEGSGGVGLYVTTPGYAITAPATLSQTLRIVGGASYPAEMVVSAFPKIYPGLAQHDSLLGNARDTLVVTGGVLKWYAYPSSVLPWRVTGDISVEWIGILNPGPGATLTMDFGVGITAREGGRVSARGTNAAPVRFTGNGWDGIELDGTPALPSYLTNVRIENTNSPAVFALYDHPVIIDSAVIRQTGSAAWLFSSASRISRTRVDTTFGGGAALALNNGVTMESTLIRGSSGPGLAAWAANVQGCEIRESAGRGIEVFVSGLEVHGCNLVDNGGEGIFANDWYTGDVEGNWWGDAAGPAGPAGDGVTGAGLDYTPWLTSPAVLPYVP